MNSVVLIGRLTAEPELRYTTQQTAVCTFNIAVDRGGKDDTADFPTIVAWRNTAEFISKYFRKGTRIAIQGQIRTRTYEGNDGKKVYVTEVYADRAEFADGKKDGQATGQQRGQQSAPEDNGGWQNVPDEGLPWGE